MPSEKNGSPCCHVDPLTKSTVNNSAEVQEITTPKDTLWAEAWAKTKRTVQALLNMCKECNQDQPFCPVFTQAQKSVVHLTEKGFTVLELQCQQQIPPIKQTYIPSISWHSVCEYCPEQYLTNKKEECLQKRIAGELQILHQNHIHITELLCLHNTIQSAYFTD